MTTAVMEPAGTVPPEIVRAGQLWRVRRAWPAGRHGTAVELAPADQHPHRQPGDHDAVRAGWWRPTSGLDLLPAGRDRRLPALASVDGTLVSHRPGKRAVVRTVDGTYVKVVRAGRATAILDGIARAAPLAATFRMPTVVGADESTVEFTTLAGRSLHDADAYPAAAWLQAWREVLGAHAAAASETPAAAASEIPAAAASDAHPAAHEAGPAMIVHDATAEVAVLRRWTAHWTGSGAPTWAADLERAASRVADELLAGEPGPLRVIHRDLHDKQLLWDPHHGPGLLDVDTACWGEGALDLGNLRAHARWREVQGVWAPDRTAAVLSAIDRAARRAGSTERVAQYERASLLRVACVHAFRPADRHLVAHLIAAATQGRRPAVRARSAQCG